jgi:hypothetical protein
VVVFEELTFYGGDAVSSLTFSHSMTHASAIRSLFHAVVSSSAKHSHRLDIFPNRLDRFSISTPTT